VNGGYSFNGIVSEASPAVDVVRDILQHFRGYLVYNQGVYQLKVDTVDTPVWAFDEDNIKAGTFVITQTPISERPNRVRVKYTDATENYSQKDVMFEPDNPIISLDDYVIEHILTISKCVYKDQAYRLAQTIGRQAQLGNTCQFITGQDGAYVDIGNVITVTWPPANWIDKQFRVVEIEEKPDEEFGLSCVEYDETVYADEYTG
ncbi:MAG: phage tail protein, partial [bacterium]